MMFGPSRSISFGQPVNWGHPLCRGLVSWWLALPNWNTGGKWFDLCGRNHGTLTNMDPATDWLGPLGRQGGFGSLEWAGGGERVNIGTFFNTFPFSISFWIKTTTTSNYVLGWMNNPTNAGWFVYVRSGGTLAIQTAASGFSNVATGDATYANGQWHHATLVCSASNSQAWFTNGIADGTGSIANNGSSDDKVFGNIRPVGAGFLFTGLLDDIAYYNRALSASEVSALYNDSRRGHPEMLNWIRPTWYLDQVGGGGGGGGGIVRHMIAMAG